MALGGIIIVRADLSNFPAVALSRIIRSFSPCSEPVSDVFIRFEQLKDGIDHLFASYLNPAVLNVLIVIRIRAGSAIAITIIYFFRIFIG